MRMAGEVYTLKLFYEMDPKTRPPASECILLSTHQPCSMCLSAIVWSGFDIFSYEDTEDEFSIPHDLKILRDVFACRHVPQRCSYYDSFSLPALVEAMPDGTEKLAALSCSHRIRDAYSALSRQYQANKDMNSIPLN